MRKGIVLLNMGGPGSMDEVHLFLKNMFYDPNIIPIKNSLIRRFVSLLIASLRVKKARLNYEQIGKKSPLKEHTELLAAKLQEHIGDLYVTYAMRYTPPYAADAIRELRAQATKEVYLIPLYPHYSTTTTKSSLENFYQEARALGFHARFYEISSYYQNSLYNQAIIERIQEALGNNRAEEFDLIFSAHGLPQKVIDRKDPYQRQVRGNLFFLRKMLLQKGLRFAKTHLAYQSKVGPMKWTQPSLDQKLKSLKNKKVLIYPISFTIDNSETDFELRIEYNKLAKELGFEEYRVCQCLNDSETFIRALADLYRLMGGAR